MIIESLIVMGFLGLMFGVILAWASRLFEIKESEKVARVLEALPGINCGGCGYPSCREFASAVIEKKTPINGCKIGKEEVAKKVEEAIGED